MKKIYLIILLLISNYGNLTADIPDSLQNLLGRANSDTAKALILLKASARINSPDPEKAEQYANAALLLAQKAGNQKLIAKSYYTLGTAAYINKTLEQSHGYFLKALNIFESLHDVYYMATLYSAIGDVLGDEGDGKHGIEYYQKAKVNFLALKDTMYSIYMDMSIAGTLGMMKMDDSSLAYSLSILPKAQKTHNKELISKVICNIAGSYLSKADTKQALNYYLQALPYFVDDNDPVELALEYNNIAGVCYEMGNYADALKYGLLAYKKNQEVKSLSGMVTVGRQIAATYTSMKQYEKADEWYGKTDILSDTLFSNNMTAKVAEMQSKYESVKKDQEIKVQKSELTRQQFVIYGSLGFAVIVLLVIIVLYINFRKINRLGKELTQQKEKLQELNGVKDKLFSIISHDLRNPLGSLKNMATLFKMNAVSPEKINDFSASMEATLDKTMQLMDNLLHWATIQMKERNTRPEELPVNETITEAVNGIKEEAIQKSITIETDFKCNETVLADENVLLLVLRNLLSNAVKFTNAGGSVSVTSSKSGNKIYITVADTGIGINENTLMMLRNSSTTVSTKGTGQEKGYGLGLQLCKEYAGKWGGGLQIDSIEGGGSKFSFSMDFI